MLPAERQKMEAMERRLRGLEAMTAAAPLSISRVGGVPGLYLKIPQVTPPPGGFYAALLG